MAPSFFEIITMVIYGGLLAHAAPAMVPGNDVLVAGDKTYGIVDINWNFLINNTDVPYNLSVTGTIQDVFASIQQADPDTATSIQEHIEAKMNTTQSVADINLSSSPAEETGDIPTNYYCNVPGWSQCSISSVFTGMYYLDGISGHPTNGPGPGNCGRVSCSYDAAIWWCNDNSVSKTLDYFGMISGGVADVLKHCEDSLASKVKGQQFFNDGWNVIVREQSC